MSRTFLLSVLFLLCAAFGIAPAAGDGPVTPERPAEYMVYQYAGTALVISADLPEAGFGVRVLDPERAALRVARLQGRRLGPVYLYIDAHDLPRQLMIEITPDRAVDRSAIGLELIQFAAGDPRDAALARAYRQFSIGVEAARSDDAATWAAKVYSLREAAVRFAELGREELRLWSQYYAAQLVLFELDDPLLAAELARDVRDSAGRPGLELVAAAALLLEADAEAIRLAADSEPGPAEFQRAGGTLGKAADTAAALGLHTEQARIGFLHGQLLERQGDTTGALEEYRRSLDALTAPERSTFPDTELLNAVRAAAAASYERQGRTSGALAMLEEMGEAGSPADDDEARREEAARLYERGRLLNLAFRHDEAAAALQRALVLQQGPAEGPARALTALELAWSDYALGRDEEAVDLLQDALPRVPGAEFASAVARAWGSLADIYRRQQDWDATARARANQRERLQAAGGAGLAEALFENALDEAARRGRDTPAVADLLQESRRAAEAQGDVLAAARAGLRLCLAQGQDADCGASALRTLRAGGVPRLAVEARYTHARLLARSGRTADARREMERALGEVHWYRTALPGVLGPWYHAHVNEFAAAWLSLNATPELPAEQTLWALELVRGLDYGAVPVRSLLTPEQEETLRGLLARREAAGAAEARGLAGEIDRALAAARRECSGCVVGSLSVEAVRQRLDGLGRSEAVLAVYLGDEEGWVVLAGRTERRRLPLAAPGRVRDGLQALRTDLPDAGLAGMRGTLDEMGRLLLAPLAEDLPHRIYLLPAGLLRAVPLDVLRVEGDYLAARSEVVGVSGLDSLDRLPPAVQPGYRDRVFVAGNPQTQRDPFRFDMSTSPEVAAVTALFVGPGLHVVQGVALGRDEFADPRYTGAALLHLALPGVADLGRPERSRLVLSGTADAAGVHGLSPADLRGIDVAADLAVLTGTTVAITGEAAHAGRVPLVSDLLDAGAGAVVFSLWPVGEAVAEAFARAFYAHLAQDPDIVSAFLAGRAGAAADSPEPEFENGPGFQLFIR